MDRDERDRVEVDLLVRHLAVSEPAPEQPVAAAPTRARPELRPGSRWTNVRVQMPARRGPGVWTRLARAVGDRVPDLPEFGPLIPMLAPATTVRVWVGLGVVLGAAMTFWPYPKTYFLGLVLYILSLGVLMLAGIWGARLSWDARLGAAHTVALGTALWAVALTAAEALPLA